MIRVLAEGKSHKAPLQLRGRRDSTYRLTGQYFLFFAPVVSTVHLDLRQKTIGGGLACGESLHQPAKSSQSILPTTTENVEETTSDGGNIGGQIFIRRSSRSSSFSQGQLVLKRTTGIESERDLIDPLLSGWRQAQHFIICPPHRLSHSTVVDKDPIANIPQKREQHQGICRKSVVESRRSGSVRIQLCFSHNNHEVYSDVGSTSSPMFPPLNL